MVDAGDFFPHKICHVPSMLLRIHAYDPVRFPHALHQALVGRHGNPESIQHLRGAQLINLPVIAQHGLHPIVCQQLLQAVRGGDGIRIREIVGLDIDRAPLAQPGKCLYVVHGSLLSSCRILMPVFYHLFRHLPIRTRISLSQILCVSLPQTSNSAAKPWASPDSTRLLPMDRCLSCILPCQKCRLAAAAYGAHSKKGRPVSLRAALRHWSEFFFLHYRDR